MEDRELKSMDRAIRPSQAMPRPLSETQARRFRSPEEQAEIDRRVAIYTAQVEQTGRLTWLPRRGEGRDS